MNYFIIKDLKIENFYFNSSMYLHKELEDESARENERIINSTKDADLLLNQTFKYQQLENLFNSNFKTNKSILRNKIHDIYNQIDIEDNEDLDASNEKDLILKEKIKSDKLIILQKSIFASNQQINVSTFSLLVLELGEISFGIFIDKQIVSYFINNEEGDTNG